MTFPYDSARQQLQAWQKDLDARGAQLEKVALEASRVQTRGTDLSPADIAAIEKFARSKDAPNALKDLQRKVDAGQMSWRDITEESIDHVLAVDIKGTMACIHEFGRRMLDQGHGSIVNIGSTVIVRGSARAPQYAAAKYGLLGATKSYAHAFAPTVRVNVFAPGFIETEATLGREDWRSGRGDQLRSLTPMGRIPGPAEVAGAALFLATDDAAHITGTYMVADGGYNMVGA